MAGGAIRHPDREVIARQAAGVDAVAGIAALTRRQGRMVEVRKVGEIGGVVTVAAVAGDHRVRRHRCRAGNVERNETVAGVAIRAGLADRVDHRVVETVAEIEAVDPVANAAVDADRRVVGRRPGSVDPVAAVAAHAGHRGAAVVGTRVGAGEALGGMAEHAVGPGVRVRRRRRLAERADAVVAIDATRFDVAVIETAVDQLEETDPGLKVAVVAGLRGFDVAAGLADGDDVVMAIAAGAEHLVVIDPGRYRPA